MPHSDECRARITAELEQTEQGKMRLERQNARTDRFLAEHLRQHVEGEPADAQGRRGDENVAHQQVPPWIFCHFFRYLHQKCPKQ